MSKEINEKENDQNLDRYFDEDQYSTLIVADEKTQKEKKKGIEDFVELITSRINEDKTEVLLLLKEANAQEALLESILNIDNIKVRNLLIAACWESGLDFGMYAESFFKLAIEKDLLVSLEAITVVENIEKFESKIVLEKGIAMLAKAIEEKHENHEMLLDLKLHLFEMLKAFDAGGSSSNDSVEV